MIRLPFYYNPSLLGKFFAPGAAFTSNIPKILLTFDDGPTPDVTEQVLDWLSARGLTGLFFMLGNKAEQHPEIVQKVLSQGSAIGCHAFSHTNLTRISQADAARLIHTGAESLRKAAGVPVTLFRPPYGAATVRIRARAAAFGLRTVYWSLLTEDYKNDLNIVKFTVSNYLRDNSIVLLHDRQENFPVLLPALDFLFETAAAKGYRFGNCAECLN